MACDIKKAAELKAKIDSEQDVRNAEKLRDLLKTKEELDALNEGLRLEGGGFADDSFVKMLGLSLNMTETAEKCYNDNQGNDHCILLQRCQCFILFHDYSPFPDFKMQDMIVS